MIIRGEVTLEQCARIAKAMNCELYNSGTYDMETVQRSGKRMLKFTLRPLSGMNTYRSKSLGYGYSKERKIWAVDWQGHYVFMRAVFYLDPNARITTRRADYRVNDGIHMSFLLFI